MTFISKKTLDDLLQEVYQRLLSTKSRVTATKGENGEIFGILLELKDPRARISRAETRSTIYSCLGEFLWYMSGSNTLEFIQHYIPQYKKFAEEDGNIHGGYGPRLRSKDGIDQIQFVIDKLSDNPDSRKAVIQLYDSRDTKEDYKDVPCTCTLQFVIRNGLLHMQTHMRSNDAFMGLPHDVFCFTMLQEMLACTLGVKLGPYKHAVGSLHLYKPDNEAALNFIDEGYQDDITMPAMPKADPWGAVKRIIQYDQDFRNGVDVDKDFPDLDPYWGDIARLMALTFNSNLEEIEKIADKMEADFYKTYVRKKYDRALQKEAQTLDLFSSTDGDIGKSNA